MASEFGSTTVTQMILVQMEQEAGSPTGRSAKSLRLIARGIHRIVAASTAAMRCLEIPEEMEWRSSVRVPS